MSDPDRASTFFEQAFGWSATPRSWSGGVHLPLQGAAGEVGCALTETGFAGPLPVVHVDRDEMHACLLRIVEAGGEVVEPQHAVDDLGSFARFRDSEGNLWGLWAPA